MRTKKATFTPLEIINFFLGYELDIWSWDLHSDFTWKNCLVWGVKFAKNTDADKYFYAGYGIGVDSLSEFGSMVAWVKMSLFL